jgi:hypothetical protein
MNFGFGAFIDPIQPIAEHICNIGWWGNVKSKLYNSPNKMSKGTSDK